MNVVVWLIVGGLVGCIAHLIMHTHAQRGLLLNLMVGIAGAAFIVGCFIAPAVGVSSLRQAHLSPAGLVLSLAGASVLLATIHLVRRAQMRRYRRRPDARHAN